MRTEEEVQIGKKEGKRKKIRKKTIPQRANYRVSGLPVGEFGGRGRREKEREEGEAGKLNNDVITIITH